MFIMDSTHSHETQNTQVLFKSTASNTSPIVCASCGSNDYFQTISPINFLRAFYPAVPRFRQSSENCGDGFSIHQPIFTSPPLLQPLFNSSPIPNVFYAQTNLRLTSSNHNISQEYRSENERQSSPCGDFTAFETNKIEYKGKDVRNLRNVGQHYHDFPKNAKPLPSEKNSSKKPVETESNSSTYAEDCSCRNSIPWTYSPLIVPIIPYYLLWNSRCPNVKTNLVNYSFTKTEKNLHTETEHKSNEEVSEHKNHSGSCDDDNQVDLKKQQENFREGTKNQIDVGKECESSVSISSSSDGCEENIHPNESRQNEDVLEDGNDSEDRISEKTVTREEINASNTDKEEVADGEEIAENKELPCQSEEDDCNDFDAKGDSDSETRSSQNNDGNEQSSEPPFETRNNDGDEAENEMSESQDVEDVTLENNHSTLSVEKSQEVLEDVGECKKEKCRNRTINKKSYNNYTITDQTSNELLNDIIINVMDVAAGDLGNEGCSYKVTITPSMTDQTEGLTESGGTEENSGSDTSLKDSIEKTNDSAEPSNSKTQKIVLKEIDIISSDKNSTAKTKSPRTFKSGIAKLSSNFKAKESKADISESATMPIKEPIKKEIQLPKRRHNCFPTENLTTACESHIAIQKRKNSEGVQGTEKQKVKSKSICIKEKLQKGNEKKKPTAVRQNSNTQKDTLSTCKK